MILLWLSKGSNDVEQVDDIVTQKMKITLRIVNFC